MEGISFIIDTENVSYPNLGSRAGTANSHNNLTNLTYNIFIMTINRRERYLDVIHCFGSICEDRIYSKYRRLKFYRVTHEYQV